MFSSLTGKTVQFVQIESTEVNHVRIYRKMFIHWDEKQTTQVMEAESERCLLSKNSIKTKTSQKTVLEMASVKWFLLCIFFTAASANVQRYKWLP
ncbi:unnamed protein product [Cuscuta campestris]|uniref:Uncharacterized protein n=1 Tax=Cuscuta campestris TaxID=132261 RepID=A0A484MI72_9ASTE|nr:unnamed protein product [Cuscuta campestris]